MHVFAPSQHRLTMRRDQVAPAPRKPLVLVVEDDECARKALAMLLNDDYDVVEAANGREALATLAKGARPDVILLDLVMPQMDGWEFMKRQRSDWRLCTIPTGWPGSSLPEEVDDGSAPLPWRLLARPTAPVPRQFRASARPAPRVK